MNLAPLLGPLVVLAVLAILACIAQIILEATPKP
jgi:hypothetical protein